VISIGDEAFDDCGHLTFVTVLNPVPPRLEGCVFSASLKKEKVCLYVPSSSIAAYRSADGWKEFSNIQDAASR